ncbi:MAG: MEDS domain-containing protein [Methanomassiliicoccus sp.]|nr:MEDS domain-containing protein [Methanomassiliicoccus sp.]
MVDQVADEALVAAEPERNTVEDHIALIFHKDEERLTTITPLIKVGLEKGELCLYVSNEENDQAIVEALRAEHIDVEKAVSNGSLILTNKREMYFKLGRFDPEWTIRVINNIADLARSYGFTAMRVMSEMAWTQEMVAGIERWPEYEAKLNALNPGISLRIICQYDRRLFSPEALMAAIQTHPRIVADGEISKNSFFIPSDRLLMGNYAEAELEMVMASIRQLNSSEAALQDRDSIIERLTQQADADNAARKSLEAALDESRHRFKEFAERASDWAWELDEQGAFIYSSPRIRDILGMQPEEIIGKTPMDLVSKEAADRTAKLLTPAMSSHAPISALEMEARHKDGHVVYLEMNGTPRFDQDGKFQGYRGVDRDISGRKASKQAIEESRRRAEESLAEIKARDERIAALDQEIVQLKGSLAEFDSSLTALRGEIDGKENILREANENLARLNESLQAREAEISTLRASHDEKQSTLEAQADEIADLKRQLEERGGELSGIQAALAAAQLAVLGKTSELEKLTSGFNAQSLELKGARDSLSGVEETLAHKEQESFAMRQQIDRLEADLKATKESLAMRSEEFGRAQQELSEAKVSLEQVKGELAVGSEELAQKVKDLAGAEELAEQRARELAAANEAIEAKTGELVTVNGSLEQKVAEIAAVTALAEGRATELSSVKEDLERTQSELSSTKVWLERAASDLAAAKQLMEQRTSELGAANEAIEAKTGELAAMNASLEQKAAELAAANELAEQRASELAAMSASLEQKAAELAAAESRVAEKDGALVGSLAEVEGLKAMLSSRESDLEARTAERDARLEEIAQAREDIDRLEQTLVTRGGELAGTVAACEGVKADLAALTEELQLARESIDRVEEEKVELRSTIEARDVALADLNAVLGRTTSDLAAREGELATVRAVLSERERELSQASSRVDVLSKILVLKEEELSASLKISEARRCQADQLDVQARQLEADQNVSVTVISGLREAMHRGGKDLAQAKAEHEAALAQACAAAARERELAGARWVENVLLRTRVQELEASRNAATGEAMGLRKAFMGLASPAAMVSPEGKIILANPAMEQIMSMDLAGRATADLWPGLDISEPGSIRIEQNGQLMEMKVLPSALRDGMQDIGTVLTFGEPVPIRAAESKGPNPAALAHDLNDSLQVIMGSVSLAKEYVIPEGRMYSKLRRIESASVTARDLASQLMSPAREVHLDASSVPTNLTRGKGRLLLMDDDENVLEATGDLLRYLGYNVEVARDGEEAVAMCKEAEEIWQSYDLAMVDLSISSGMGGLEASKSLVAMNPRIALIVTSGYISDPVIADPKAHGFAAALSKPYSAELLSKTIAEVLASQPSA